MPEVVKVISQEQTVNTTPNTVSLATLVRVFNANTTDNYLITVRDAANNILGSLTIGFNGSEESVVYLRKSPTDTVEANNSTYVKGVSVGYF
jgi:hypothetical protein